VLFLLVYNFFCTFCCRCADGVRRAPPPPGALVVRPRPRATCRRLPQPVAPVEHAAPYFRRSTPPRWTPASFRSRAFFHYSTRLCLRCAFSEFFATVRERFSPLNYVHLTLDYLVVTTGSISGTARRLVKTTDNRRPFVGALRRNESQRVSESSEPALLSLLDARTAVWQLVRLLTYSMLYGQHCSAGAPARPSCFAAVSTSRRKFTPAGNLLSRPKIYHTPAPYRTSPVAWSKGSFRNSVTRHMGGILTDFVALHISCNL